MYGIIDIGSNTIRLSVYKKENDTFRLLINKKEMAGLAGYVDEQGNLTNEGIKCAISALLSFRRILENIEVKDVYVFATASLRNINNTTEAVSEISDATGFFIDLISGEEEAILDFIGATCFMDLSRGVMVDIGGGSTELVFYKDGKIEDAFSLPVGSLSLHSKFVSDITPTKKEIAAMQAHVKKLLPVSKKLSDRPIICGVGGSVRGAFKLYNAINHTAQNNREMPVSSLQEILLSVQENRKQTTKKILKVAPERIHTLIPGMTILEIVADQYKSQTLMVSQYGVREGYLYRKLFGESAQHEHKK